MIHRYWTGPPSPLEPWLGRVVASMHPGELLRDWTDATLPAAVLAWLNTKDAEVAPDDRPRHRSNLVRWWALVEYGGIWLDHDTQPLIDLRTLPVPWTASLSHDRVGCAMGFERNDPIARMVLDWLHPLRSPSSDRAPLVSGDHAALRLLPESVGRQRLPWDRAGRIVAPLWSAPFIHAWTTSAHRTSTTLEGVTMDFSKAATL